MPRHLETAAVLKALAEIREVQGLVPPMESAKPIYRDGALENRTLDTLVALLRSDWILSVQGYFLNHRPDSAYAQLDDESKVQDLVYCLASSVIPDLHYEDPQRKARGALTSTRVDFSSRSASMLVEVKLATGKHQAKKVEAEISEDIVKYGRHRSFDILIFFVFCHSYAFPNPREFELGFTGSQQIGGHRFQTLCIVRP
jgi:hypothetical protein